jgi:hypothetical protein
MNKIIRRRRRWDGNEWHRGIRIWKAVVMSHQERLEETSEKPASKQPASGQGIETRTSRETDEQMFIKFTRRLFLQETVQPLHFWLYKRNGNFTLRRTTCMCTHHWPTGHSQRENSRKSWRRLDYITRELVFFSFHVVFYQITTQKLHSSLPWRTL